ncbi:hypothetical protein CJF42_22455 [Pseudoalteromonas sp. NBT06-2]|uniref:hypothetical protein n=1 Tax=Pseudoalteromonas sp. NBT06-2 TaxID=2025950 RepID=UPI000BA6C61F|nr:hypothetical protein [Pseudoalteromonas sp. NBT06-2]PAJ72213.1 hypothetical protein CJF42_22455 [Pseudoalteromonas sp. NBT06-2]
MGQVICRYKHYRFILFALYTPYTVLANTTSTNFYQCETDKGVIFSQLPCSKDAKLKKISTFTPRKIRNTNTDIKSLNKIQYQQRLQIVESKLSSSQNKVRVLKRTQAKKQVHEEQKLERMMSKQDKIITKKQVELALKKINKKYNKLVKVEEKNLSHLTKELKKFQKKK